MIIECQTDSKAKTLADVRSIIHKAEGTATPTQHLFEKKGRVLFENPEGLTEEDILESAIEAGAEDVEVKDDQEIEMWCEPRDTSRISKGMLDTGLKCRTAEIVWVAREDMKVPAPEDGEALEKVIGMFLLSSRKWITADG